MPRAPLDVLREHNRARKQGKEKGPLAFLRLLNEEQRRQKQRDRLLDILAKRVRPRKGTLIIGVQGKEGVVIASDQKVERGSETEYTNKVFQLDLGGPLLFAAEGLTGIRDDFFLLLDAEIRRRKGVDTLYEVKVIVEDIIASLTERYAERVQQSTIGVLMAGLQELTKGPAVLYYIHPPGYGELSRFVCSGSGGEHAYSLAKFLFDPYVQPEQSLEEAAKRVAFVIAWVAEDVNSDVGGAPQVAILRNNASQVEILREEIIDAQEQAAKEKKTQLPNILGFTQEEGRA